MKLINLISSSSTQNMNTLFIISILVLLLISILQAVVFLKYKKNNVYTKPALQPPNNTDLIQRDSHVENDDTDYSLVDSKIITNIIEQLYSFRDLDSSIEPILNTIGTFYNLSYVGILESLTATNEGYFTHIWHNCNRTECDCNIKFSATDINQIKMYNIMNNDYYVSSDLKNSSELSATMEHIAKNNHITGLLECDLLKTSYADSYLIFCFSDEKRKWKQQEIDTLLLLTKLLSNCINRIEKEKKVQWLEKTDSLTNCNNFVTFKDEAYNILQANPDSEYIMFSSDIEKFKVFNEKYGYEKGNQILIEFSKCLNSICEENETFGRISADKFVGLFKYDNPKYFLSKIKLLNDNMNSVFAGNNESYHIPIIIGLCPVDRTSTISKNLDQANMARQSIVNRHKSRYAFFHESMKEKLIRQLEIESCMEEALSNNEIKVYYQPKFDLKTNKHVGAEALVRWHHSEKGILYPADFISIFEENGFITNLDYYVFEQVFEHIQKLLNQGIDPKPVSVNLSRLHLNSMDIIHKLDQLLQHYSIDAKYIEIELTESALQCNSSYMFTILLSLHKMGFKISMDDFGSGMSSLNLLRTLPCDILKLDKDFLQNGSITERDQIVITTIVNMAHDLHMTIICEGVESVEQADFLRSINCDQVQGFLFSKAITQEQYEGNYYNQ